MKKNLKTILLLLSISIVITFSCEAPLDPKGYISAVDKTPPDFEIVAPAQHSNVKGYLIVKLLVKEFFGVDRVMFRSQQGNQIMNEFLGQNGDTLVYKIEVSVWEGDYDLKVEVIDMSENIGTKQLSINVTPIIKYEYKTATTASVDIYSVKEDNKGNLWFATDEGLFKYDGISFLTNVPGFDLPYPRIRALAIDRNDVIWVNYRKQFSSDKPRLVAFDGNQIIKNIEFPNPSHNASYNSFAIGTNDTLYGTGYYYYFKFKDDNWTVIYEVADNFFYSTLNDYLFRVWMNCRYEIKLLENNSWTIINAPYSVAKNYFVVDDSLNLWVKRTDQNYSLAKYNGSGWSSFDLVPSYSEINAFDVDKNGNLWVSSDEGLFKFNSNGVLIKKVSSLVNIRFIKADSYNNIWLRVNFGIMRLNEGGV
jgi:hypothetical protein